MSNTARRKPLSIKVAMEGVRYSTIHRHTARVLEYTSPHGRAFRMNRTDIIRFHLDGSVTFNIRGDNTWATVENINHFIAGNPYGIRLERQARYSRVRGYNYHLVCKDEALCCFEETIRFVPLVDGVLVLALEAPNDAPFLMWCIAGACWGANEMRRESPHLASDTAGQQGERDE